MNTISTTGPSICITDYIQLLKDYDDNTLSCIIESFSNIKNNSIRLVLLSQCVLEVEEQQRRPHVFDIVGAQISETVSGVCHLSLERDFNILKDRKRQFKPTFSHHFKYVMISFKQ